MIHVWSDSSPACYGGLRVSRFLPPDALKHPGGVAPMTRDRGYPDWLVLSARLLAQPSCGQVTIVQNICLIMFPCGYVKILQPVAICTVIFVTDGTKDTLSLGGGITGRDCLNSWIRCLGKTFLQKCRATQCVF